MKQRHALNPNSLLFLMAIKMIPEVSSVSSVWNSLLESDCYKNCPEVLRDVIVENSEYDVVKK